MHYRGIAVLGLVFLLLGPLGSAPLHADDSRPTETLEPMDIAPANLDAPGPQGWDYAIPVGNLLGVNLAFWAVARYGLEADYAYIGPDTIADNLREGFEWDADVFPTNQIGHPYQGGLYHAGARALGFGYWTSFAYTVLGSLQWEIFMEQQLPSYNDLITTSFGGAAFGEALFRLSSYFIDNSSHGSTRVWREAGVLTTSPTHGLTRLFSGAASQPGPPSASPQLVTRLALGPDRLRPMQLRKPVIGSLGFDARFEYGTPTGAAGPFEPFDWFVLTMGVNFGDRALRAVNLDLTGLLLRWRLGCGQAHTCVAGIFQHYDYNDSPIFKVGTSALGGAFLANFALLWDLDLSLELDLGAILLGGFDSPYAEVVGRDYNLGSGSMFRLGLQLAQERWGRLQFEHTRYYVHTVHGAEGNEFAGITQTTLEIPVYGGAAIAIGGVVYDRVGIPRDYPRVQSSYVVGQTQLVWTFR